MPDSQSPRLTLYGRRQSRAARCLWALEELGLPYAHVPFAQYSADTRTPEYLALNPSGKIPTLVDGDFVVSESIAITLYLAFRHGGPLWPTTAEDQARVMQWSSWATAEAELPLTVILEERRRPEGPDAAVVNRQMDALHKTLAVLELALADGANHLLPGRFTLADLNAASAVRPLATMLDMNAFPAISIWLDHCHARPAWTRANARP